MHSVSCAVCAELSSDAVGSLLLSYLSVGGSNELSPFLDRSRSNQLKSSHDIRLDELTQIRVKRFPFMLSIEKFGSLRSESAHFQLGNHETRFHDSVNYFASGSVDIWFDHGESSLFSVFEFLSCEDITIVSNFELSGVNSYDGSEVELLPADSFVGSPLQEHPSVLHVVHVDRAVLGVEGEQVLPY